MLENQLRRFSFPDRQGFSEDTSRNRTRSYLGPDNVFDTIIPMQYDEPSRPHVKLVVDADTNKLPFAESGLKPYFQLDFEPKVGENDIENLQRFMFQLPLAAREQTLLRIFEKGLPKSIYSSQGGLIFGDGKNIYFDIDQYGNQSVDPSLRPPYMDQSGEVNVSPDGKVAFRTIDFTQIAGFEFLSGIYLSGGEKPMLLKTFSGITVNRELYAELEAHTRAQIHSHDWDDTFAYHAINPFMRVELDEAKQ